jgi:FHA domain
MATCPEGHDSLSDDYCDICGMRIAAAPDTAAAVAPAGSPASAPATSAESCPRCGSPKTPGAFCEACGFNYASGTPASAAPSPASTAPAASTWSAVVAADRGYYDQVQAVSGDDASGITFPAYCPERRFVLAGAEMRIGRRSPSRGLDPEIDLTGPPTDPGISRLHAVLMATQDGWAVLDPGSANGTQVNGTDIPTSQQVPLHDGDRISLGAWTTITIHTT